jgi:uncharacterized lipoprotein YmbA
MKFLWATCAIGLLCACATSRPDRFYILTASPAAADRAPSTPSTSVMLKVTLPSLVDRPELILNTTADGVIVLEHERWGAPLADLVVQTLGQDIERRRGDLSVDSRGGARLNGDTIKITVDVVQMTARRGDRVSIETHWRIIDARKSSDIAGKDVSGNEIFSAPLGEESYAALAQALSDCLAKLADRLITQIQ